MVSPAETGAEEGVAVAPSSCGSGARPSRSFPMARRLPGPWPQGSLAPFHSWRDPGDPGGRRRVASSRGPRALRAPFGPRRGRLRSRRSVGSRRTRRGRATRSATSGRRVVASSPGGEGVADGGERSTCPRSLVRCWRSLEHGGAARHRLRAGVRRPGARTVPRSLWPPPDARGRKSCMLAPAVEGRSPGPRAARPAWEIASPPAARISPSRCFLGGQGAAPLARLRTGRW